MVALVSKTEEQMHHKSFSQLLEGRASKLGIILTTEGKAQIRAAKKSLEKRLISQGKTPKTQALKVVFFEPAPIPKATPQYSYPTNTKTKTQIHCHIQYGSSTEDSTGVWLLEGVHYYFLQQTRE